MLLFRLKFSGRKIEKLQADLTLVENVRSDGLAPFAGRGRPEGSEYADLTALEDRLVTMGFSAYEIEAIRRSEAKRRMAMAEVDDRARREGWYNSSRYFDEMNSYVAGMDDIRAEIGEDAFDRYLYAMDKPNRVSVDTVFDASPAAKTGIRAGDVITHYDGEFLYSLEQLNNFRSAGERGVPVTIELVRDGQNRPVSAGAVHRVGAQKFLPGWSTILPREDFLESTLSPARNRSAMALSRGSAQ